MECFLGLFSEETVVSHCSRKQWLPHRWRLVPLLMMAEGLCMQIKKKQSKSGKPLSMGFGFVEFDSVDTARMVCQNLQVLIFPIVKGLIWMLLCSFILIVAYTGKGIEK